MGTTAQGTATPAYAGARGSTAAAAIVSAAGLGDEARALLQPDDKPRAYLDRLLAAEHAADVVRFLAYVLPKREAVWWVWVCARKAAGDAPAPAVKVALEAVERWIVQPTDDTRRAAFVAAEAADVGTPAGCAGLAVFFSGGSIAPASVSDVPPPEGMTAKAVVNGITFAAIDDPERMDERWKEFAAMGLEVADRIKLFGA
jgi:hypothetical protein